MNNNRLLLETTSTWLQLCFMIMSYYKTEAHQGDGIRLEEYDLLLTVQKGHARRVNTQYGVFSWREEEEESLLFPNQMVCTTTYCWNHDINTRWRTAIKQRHVSLHVWLCFFVISVSTLGKFTHPRFVEIRHTSLIRNVATEIIDQTLIWRRKVNCDITVLYCNGL